MHIYNETTIFLDKLKKAPASSLKQEAIQRLIEELKLGPAQTAPRPFEPTELNGEMLSRFNFTLDRDQGGSYLVDRRKLNPVRINRHPLKTNKEVLNFLGGWILRILTENNKLFKGR